MVASVLLYSFGLYLDQTHLLHKFGNVVTKSRRLLHSKDTSHNLHPEGRYGMELLERRRFDARSKNLAAQAVEAKILLRLGLLADGYNRTGSRFLQVRVESVVVLQVTSSLQTALRVDQMTISEPKRLRLSSTVGCHDNPLGFHNVGNGALRMGANLIKRMLLALVSDHCVDMKARRRAVASRTSKAGPRRARSGSAAGTVAEVVNGHRLAIFCGFKVLATKGERCCCCRA